MANVPVEVRILPLQPEENVKNVENVDNVKNLGSPDGGPFSF
jgi:hypothetical protein